MYHATEKRVWFHRAVKCMASQVDAGESSGRALGLLILSVPVLALVRAGTTRGAHTPTEPRSFHTQLLRNESRFVKHARHLKTKGKNRRRHQRRHSESSASSMASTMQLEEDSGDRWRIRLPSGRFLYHSDGSIVASRHFFSLFALRQIVSRPDVQLLSVHAGGWVAQINGTSQRLAVVPPGAPAEAAQLFWMRKRSSRQVLLGMERDFTRYLCEDATRPGTFLVGDQSDQSRAARQTDEFELQLVVDGRVVANQTTEPSSFERTVRRSTMRVAGRSIVLATYHNVGMMHWATLFWGWLYASRIHRLLLLDLDGLTCGASRTLSHHTPGLQIECATAADMTLGKQYILGKSASGVQDWGTRSNSGYFKFLRMKLRLVELVTAHGVDVVIADIDVLVLSPHFLSDMAGRGKDLVISSDARAGKYNDNYHCPCSHPMYQRLTSDWVCAGLFYMRSTKASGWFIRQVQQYMDDFTITDQDAIQGLLTGHTQVAVPQVPTRRAAQSGAKATGGAVSPLAPGFRPSGLWLKPLWLEELSTSGNLHDVTGIVPLNTPMRPAMWRKCQARQRAEGFTWEALPLNRYGNGPTMVHHWDSLFGPEAGSGSDNQTGRQFRSIHANCNAKVLLERELGGTSVLTRPMPEPFGTVQQGVEFPLF